MIISDLEHLEVVSEASNIVGGTTKHEKQKKIVVKIVVKKIEPPKAPVNVANADAQANALGKNTETSTFTSANVIQGEGSSSESSSFAKAS